MNTTQLPVLMPATIRCMAVFASICTLAAAENEQRDTRYLFIQPVVTRNDDGEEPATVRIYKEEIAKVYRQARIDVVWLPQVFFDSTSSRDGNISPDEIVKLGRERRHWGSGVPRINLIIVNAINGKRGPRGLGMTPGPICFVALPPEGKNADMEAFSIIHEMGHCLGLIHAVDDPEVDDDVPSIMGDGPFAKRIGRSALQPAHVKTIRASRLILKRNNPTADQGEADQPATTGESK